MWTLALILAYLAALVLIWRGWGILGRLGCYIGLHVLAAPAWIVLLVTGLDGNDSGHRATRIYLFAVMVGFIVASVVVRPWTLERRARYQEAMRQAAERLGYDNPGFGGSGGSGGSGGFGGPGGFGNFGGRVITDPPRPDGPPGGGSSGDSHGSGEREPRSPGGGE